MKKPFQREKNRLIDETVNIHFDPRMFDSKPRKLSKKVRETCLADLGSGSETEYHSAQTLMNYNDKSPRFLEWLIECCKREDRHLHWGLSYSLLLFKDDERVLPALLTSARKCPDEDFSNYAGLLEIFGGQEAKEILKERFNRLKDNPQTFAKMKDWNNLGFSLMDVCVSLIKLETDNVEAAECLAKLAKHPTSFNQETAVSRMSGIFKMNHYFFGNFKIREIFTNALKPLSRTNNVRLYGKMLSFLFFIEPEKTYQKFKRLYLKTKKEDRYNELAFNLIHFVERPIYWIAKLVRELPEEDSEHFRDYLNWNLVKTLKYEDMLTALREDFAAESPNKRITAINKLQHLKKEDAQLLVKEALKDEPDDFIKKKFQNYLKGKGSRRLD